MRTAPEKFDLRLHRYGFSHSLRIAGISFGSGGQGDTSISYDDQIGTVTVCGETTNDLDGDYAPQASLTIKDQNGVTVASGSGLRQPCRCLTHLNLPGQFGDCEKKK